jgi:uncharacterized membrane protein
VLELYMRYLKKINSLVASGFKNLFYLIRDRHELIEVRILLIGLFLSALLGLYLAFLFFVDRHLSWVMSSAAFANALGGRALGITTCLSAGISVFQTIVFNFYVEAAVVLVVYGFVVLIMRNVIQPKIFHTAVRQAELTAQNQKTKVKKYGAIGLFLFVMFPFFMTGPVVGSVIAYLLNYKAINNFLIVLSGTLTSIVIYSLIGNRLLNTINQYVEVDLVKKWGTIIVGLMILVFLIYHIGTVKKFLDHEIENDDREHPIN